MEWSASLPVVHKLRRLTPRRLLALLLLLLLYLSLVILNRHFFPDFPRLSPVLTTIPFRDFFLLDWEAGDYFQPRSVVVSRLPEMALLPRVACKNSTFMVVLVLSLVSDVESRQLIRNTWGWAVQNNQWPREKLPGSVEVFFILGVSGISQSLKLQLQNEALVHDDLIVGHFVDSYRNLTFKTLTGLNWVCHNCQRTQFVMKLDQDTLVDFPRMVSFLMENQNQLRNAVIGKLYFNSKRLNKGKWKISAEEYPLFRYPTFAGGPCYLISTDAVSRMVNVSQYLPFFRMEDVQVTGVVAKAMGVRRLCMPHLQNWKKESPCLFLGRHKYEISMTDLNSTELKHVWTVLTSGRCLPFADAPAPTHS